VKITAADIRRKEFKRGVRGYADDEVDTFLDAVAKECENQSRENAELQQRVEALEEQVAGHSHIRHALEKTLVAAQLQSEEIRSNAEREGESILREAETKAKAIVSELYAQTQKVQRSLMQLKLLEEDFRFKFRTLLEGYLRLLEEAPILLSGLEDSRPSPAGAAAEGANAAAAIPAVKRAPKVVVPQKDDGSTMETAEAMAVVAEEAESGKATAAPEAGAAKESPATEVRAGKRKSVDDTTEELTVEVASLVVEEGEEKEAVSGGTQEDSGEHGIFFGKPLDDSDDPFPGSGVKPGKARDFEW
jgi:cell division initiation protein